MPFDKLNNKFLCDCHLFKSQGTPHRHIFVAMRHEHLDSIPITLICKRWMKVAKSEYICSAPMEDVDTEKMV